MDNLSFRINDVVIDVPAFTASLLRLGINVTRKTIVKPNSELILFSLPVGKYKCRWLFRLNLTDKCLSCSGGVTKTFFDHNVWVFKNEAVQIAAIMGIVCDAVQQIDGIVLKSIDPFSFWLERVELTQHFVMPDGMSLADALAKIDLLFMTLFPRRCSSPEGKNHDNPGTVRLGKTKSSRVCRAYDPVSKFESKPDHVSAESWSSLKAFCIKQLRVELMFNKRELKTTGLEKLAKWEYAETVNKLIAKRYKELGLSVEFKATNEHFNPGDVRTTNPSYIDYARHWFSAGVKGSPPNPRSGAANRFKQYMAVKGYRTDVTYARHQFLVHGLHDVLVPELCADLPMELRRDLALFGKWWMAR
jgi:hypothetical protein